MCRLIPGPSEPKTFHINYYLRLLVEKLRLLVPGVHIQTKSNRIQVVKASLIMVACNLPATRKVIGMTSYNSINASSKYDHYLDLFLVTLPQQNFLLVLVTMIGLFLMQLNIVKTLKFG